MLGLCSNASTVCKQAECSQGKPVTNPRRRACAAMVTVLGLWAFVSMALVLRLLFELLLLIYDFPGRYLMSPEGGDKSSSISHQETVDLAKFLYLANKDKCDITNITVMNNITKFLSKLKEFGVGL